MISVRYSAQEQKLGGIFPGQGVAHAWFGEKWPGLPPNPGFTPMAIPVMEDAASAALKSL